MGYPHAGNDVFHAMVMYQGSEMPAFIKVERQAGADIANETNVISNLPLPYVPIILEYSLSEPRYIVTKEAEGERLSTIVNQSPETDVKKYLRKQAAVLSEIHNVHVPCGPVKDRRFFHVPAPEFWEKHNLDAVHAFLTENEPVNPLSCFVHGDFHYANILWDRGEISCVLDYELSGIGVREFDMAWSVFLRPSQNHLKTWREVMAFLNGYTSEFSLLAFLYYYVQIAAHFYPMGDVQYKSDVQNLMEEAMRQYTEAV